MKGVTTLVILYTLFASITTVINIICQILFINFYTGIFSIQLSVLIGTVAGLPVKYLLEKRHIFGFESKSPSHDAKLFSIYTIMGLFTTGIFWSFEYFFYEFFGTDNMRYVGGVIGLMIGNFLKYQLDKRYVFQMDFK